ncbi:hypothetical protein QAD02_022816 [Eretmocerus hayati]|uniref:Uncharacterized protein n=1 Tax=Eretmocerus hayati TaxID=131215 RepID=A0ACC2PU98_9HYME|nr:hypothetical protein QAD02_022816 [Eretmocerus hayati]
MLPKGASFLLALALSVALVSAQSHSLNRFLDEYASKVRRPTEKPQPYNSKEDEDSQKPHLQANIEKLSINGYGQHEHEGGLGSSPQPQQNETAKKQKLYNSNSPSDDRNGGWVTLDAVPWSKSKISRWQPNSMTQEPWPTDNKPYDKPNSNKFWDPEYSSRPSYESNKPWQNKLTKPGWPDNSPSSSNKPWHSQDRPRPNRPYQSSDKYDENPGEAQKWPPERQPWERYPESSRPHSPLDADIITDDGPPNFPKWDRPSEQSINEFADNVICTEIEDLRISTGSVKLLGTSGRKPSYTHHVDSYINEPNGWNDRNDYGGLGPSKFPTRPGLNLGPGDDYYNNNDRPHFSHYHYPSSGASAGGSHQGLHSQRHPPNYPFSGNGEWVLLSTNRGYSKSRQRSLKFDALNATIASGDKRKQGDENEAPVHSMTSNRQVRLMVLPPIDGTNTTTSHGGMLEVEKTFKTVDQSKAEYDAAKGLNEKANGKPNSSSTKAPISNVNRPTQQAAAASPGNSAVLAAVGAGMVPATMAMVLPMVLGRKKRQTSVRLESWPSQPRTNQM